MCRWIGSHFHDCIEFYGVAFSAVFSRVTRMGLYIFETLTLKRKIHGKKSRNRILICSKRLPFHSGLAKKRTKIQNTADSIKTNLPGLSNLLC